MCETNQNIKSTYIFIYFLLQCVLFFLFTLFALNYDFVTKSKDYHPSLADYQTSLCLLLYITTIFWLEDVEIIKEESRETKKKFWIRKEKDDLTDTYIEKEL